MFLADFICASFYEKLLGDEETFILYSNKVREELIFQKNSYYM